ncbi:MAG: hypothetical protein ACE5J2_05415 [Nitrososphaerales archaeon]
MSRLGQGPQNLVESLSDLRTRALRKRVWYGALNLQERILTGLITRHVKIVKNATLATVVARMIVKLIAAIKNAFLDMVERMGRPIAEINSAAAYSHGNKHALGWKDDLNYIRFLGLSAYYCQRMVIARRCDGMVHA